MRRFAPLALVLACGSQGTSAPPPAPVCTPGQQVECPCPGGGKGAQACKDDGTGYAVCECASGPATTGSGGANGSTGGTTTGTGGAGLAGSRPDSGAVVDAARPFDGCSPWTLPDSGCPGFDYCSYPGPRRLLNFDADIAPIFNAASCALALQCHGNNGVAPLLNGTGSDVLPRVVRVFSKENDAMLLVNAGFPELSWLMRKIESDNPGCGTMCSPPDATPDACSKRHAAEGHVALTDQQLAVIRDWIAAGAM